MNLVTQKILKGIIEQHLSAFWKTYYTCKNINMNEHCKLRQKRGDREEEERLRIKEKRNFEK